MKTKPILAPKRGDQLWGIYHTDREFARELGDPLRTVVEAPTKIAAEELAARLGFNEPWAHPVKPEEIEHARWLPLRAARHRQSSNTHSRGIHI